MPYFLVTSSVRDGEYEYWRHIPVEAANPAEATDNALASDREWVEEDYREVSCESVQELPKEDYDVLKKHLP
jgi:hypothetical protein